jgi:hypothetical protein
MKECKGMRGAVLTTAALGLLAAPVAGQERTLDDFEDLAAWRATPSDGVSLEIAADEGLEGRSMRLDVDFQGGGGYAVARREISLDLPENYALSFWIRGTVPANNLEIKLVDPSGENVWWVNKRNFGFPREWTRVTIKKRQIEFAWGPAGGGELRRVAAIEFAVTAGSGGEGSLWIDELALEARPPVEPYDRTPTATASTAAVGAEAARALDRDSTSAWRSASGGRQWLAVDFGVPREYGGIVIDWVAEAHASEYAVEVSDDGATWESLRKVERGDGGRDWLFLPESESRHLRLALEAGPSAGYAVAELDVRPLSFGASLNDFFSAIAAESPRGAYPRPLLGEQTYWTLVGASGDEAEGLLGEDGRLEIDPGGFSIEPFIWMDGVLHDWAEADHAAHLVDGSLPIPAVTRTHGDLELEVTALAAGDSGASTIEARYRVHNRGGVTRAITLFLAIRPFQVNPPWQFLGITGGIAEIRSIGRAPGAVVVDSRAVLTLTEPDRFGAATFDEGDVTRFLGEGQVPPRSAVEDPFARASAALAYELVIAPSDSADVYLTAPPRRDAPTGLEAGESPLELGSVPPADRFRAALAATAASWRPRVSGVELELPGAAKRLAQILASNVAFVLINRDGAAIQPGSRAYDRSWIRDGALTSSALLRVGQSEVVRDFIEWFAGYQYPSGKIPCCVDHRGADPVPEHDSHGEFVYLVAEYFRFTADTSLVRAMWPHVTAAIGYIDSLRATRLGPEYEHGEKRLFRGLLPESISHEGYSAKPVHSYWDDFFALRGLEDAVEIAEALGEDDAAARFAASRDAFRADVHASIRAAIEHHRIDFIPGSADLGDFDATSTTIGIAPGGELARLPRRELVRTFERYWEEHLRRVREDDWEAYTPYELRVVGAFVRLGWKDRAHELLDFFLQHVRPAAWNAWAEVVWRDPLTPRFIGDLPHTWVGSDYIRSILDLFAYEREDDRALVVGAGIPAAWARDPAGVRARGLRSRWGSLDLEVHAEGDSARVRLGGDLVIPAGGIIVVSPLEGSPQSASLDGTTVALGAKGHVVVRALPAEVVFRHRLLRGAN